MIPLGHSCKYMIKFRLSITLQLGYECTILIHFRMIESHVALQAVLSVIMSSCSQGPSMATTAVFLGWGFFISVAMGAA